MCDVMVVAFKELIDLESRRFYVYSTAILAANPEEDFSFLAEQSGKLFSRQESEEGARLERVPEGVDRRRTETVTGAIGSEKKKKEERKRDEWHNKLQRLMTGSFSGSLQTS